MKERLPAPPAHCTRVAPRRVEQSADMGRLASSSTTTAGVGTMMGSRCPCSVPIQSTTPWSTARARGITAEVRVGTASGPKTSTATPGAIARPMVVLHAQGRASTANLRISGQRQALRPCSFDDRHGENCVVVAGSHGVDHTEVGAADVETRPLHRPVFGANRGQKTGRCRSSSVVQRQDGPHSHDSSLHIEWALLRTMNSIPPSPSACRR